MKWGFGRSEEDFEDEIRSHIDHETDRLIAEGFSPRAARKRAHAEFGSLNRARDRFRSARRFPRMELLLKDSLLALRTMAREPLLAGVTILTLAVGIGINSSIFTMLYSLTKRPLPLPDSDRLVTVHQQFGNDPTVGGINGGQVRTGDVNRMVNGSSDMSSYAEYQNYRTQRSVFDGLAAYARIRLTFESESPVAAAGLVVSCNYFSVLLVKVQLGRSFHENECARAGEVQVAVLSDGFWQRHFGGDPGVLGRTIVLNRQSFTVVGVAPPKFRGVDLDPADIWLPVTTQPLLAPPQLTIDNMSWLNVIGRLSRSASLEEARARLTQLAQRRDAEYPGRKTTVLVYRATRLAGAPVQDDIRIVNLAALSIATLVLLIACLNVASLLLTRAPARQRSVRIRISLGADRRQIITHLLVESVVLGLLGGVAGLAFSMWVPPLVIARIPDADVGLPFTPDLHVFGYALLISLIASIVFGLVPALEAARVDLATAMRGDAAGAGSAPRSMRLRQTVVAAQLAVSLVFLVVAGLFARSLGRAQDIDPGYQVEGILAFRPDLERQGYTQAQALEFFRELRTRVGALPQVDDAALAARLPLRGRSTAPFQRGSNSSDKTPPEGSVDFTFASSDYFDVLGIPLVRGSRYTDEDVQPGGVTPVVISERMAAFYWPGRDALEQTFHTMNNVYRVVGIARDTRHASLREPDRHFFYAPMYAALAPLDLDAARQLPNGGGLVVRMTGGMQSVIVRTKNERAVSAAVVRIVRELDASVLLTVESLEDNLANELQPARLIALFAGILGTLALLLALIGVYSAVAYGVNQRLHEIGLRFALGATRADIVRLVLRQGRTPLVAGVFAGLIIASAAGAVLRGAFYGFEPLDPLTFIGGAALLVAAALLAMVRPARRAALLDPALTLRRD